MISLGFGEYGNDGDMKKKRMLEILHDLPYMGGQTYTGKKISLVISQTVAYCWIGVDIFFHYFLHATPNYTSYMVQGHHQSDIIHIFHFVHW